MAWPPRLALVPLRVFVEANVSACAPPSQCPNQLPGIGFWAVTQPRAQQGHSCPPLQEPATVWGLSWAVPTSSNQASPAQAVSPSLSAMCVLSPSNNHAQRASPSLPSGNEDLLDSSSLRLPCISTTAPDQERPTRQEFAGNKDCGPGRLLCRLRIFWTLPLKCPVSQTLFSGAQTCHIWQVTKM